MATMFRRRLRTDGPGRGAGPWLAAVIASLVALGLAPAAAGAQPDDPLGMTFVDATPNASATIHDKLRSVVERSSDIDFTDPADFLSEAEKFDVTLDTLASSDKRNGKRELIRRAMRANDLETIVVYKRQGDKLHLILLGPSGAQLEHYRSPIRQPTINDEQAVAVLKRIFEVVVPKVREFRRNNPVAQQPEPRTRTDQPAPSADDNSGGSDEADAEAGELLGGNVTLSLAPIFGTRSLVMDDSTTPEILEHRTPIFGGGARLDAIFGILEARRSALGVSGSMEFAPFKTKFPDIQNVSRGTYFRAGGRLKYYSALSETFTLFGQVGGESLHIGLSTNSIYVGSTYFAVAAGGGATIRFSDALAATIDADLLPTLLTNTNDRAFGAGGFSLGVSAGARLELRSFSPWILSATYDFLMLSPEHPKPTYDAYEGPASGTDMLHIGGAHLSYRF